MRDYLAILEERYERLSALDPEDFNETGILLISLCLRATWLELCDVRAAIMEEA